MPLRKAAEDMNLMQLLSCPGQTTCYMAQDTPGQYATGERLTMEVARKKLNEETRFPEKLELRIGAQVMLILVCCSPPPKNVMLTAQRIARSADRSVVPHVLISSLGDIPGHRYYRYVVRGQAWEPRTKS